MTTNNSPSSYRATSSIAPKVKASEEGLFRPISSKVSSALSDEYINRIKDQARTDAAKGSYMDGYEQRGGFTAIMNAQMSKNVSPDRAKAISQVSNALSSVTRAWKSGKNFLNLFGLPYSANVYKGPTRTTAEIFDENGEMIAGYHSDNGFWNSVPTKDETRFQSESAQIYREAYNAAKAELTAAQQTQSNGTARVDIRA